jgi:hypothetical protein
MNIYIANLGHLAIAAAQAHLQIIPKLQNGQYDICILESFYHMFAWEKGLIKGIKSFMLDSGAFSLLNGRNINLDSYIKRYAQFIKDNDVELFFELDIDKVVGWEKYCDYRKLLEDATGRSPIPVMHRSRGKEWYLEAVEKYPLVAIGGIAIKDIRKNEYAHFHWLIDRAHEKGCKVHALGFSSLSLLKEYDFDSCDASSWSMGKQFGRLWHFNGHDLERYAAPTRYDNWLPISIRDFETWFRYTKYLEQF